MRPLTKSCQEKISYWIDAKTSPRGCTVSSISANRASVIVGKRKFTFAKMALDQWYLIGMKDSNGYHALLDTQVDGTREMFGTMKTGEDEYRRAVQEAQEIILRYL